MRIYSPVDRPRDLAWKHLARFSIWLLVCSTSLAYDRTNEAGEAAIQDGAAECQPYWYPPVADSLSSFPAIWQTASILPNDTEALNRWNSIASSIPNIAPKGTIDGDFSRVFPTYPKNDPDCWWTYGQCVTPRLQTLQPDVYQVPESRTLGLGFDDGPNCSHNAFYDYLSSHDQKATMFYIGSNVMNWPLEAQRATADGHEVCVHTWSHHYMTAFASQIAFAELYYTIKAIELVIGVTPTCWRPPFGDVDDRIRFIAAGLGLQTILWGYDSDDWRAGVGNVTAANVDANYQQLINEAISGQFNNAGVIMLTHELNNFTMSEAMKFYPQLRAAFKQIVPVGVAMDWKPTLTGTNTTPPGTVLISNPSPTITTTMKTSGMNRSAGAPVSNIKNGAMNPHYPILSHLLPILIGISLAS